MGYHFRCRFLSWQSEESTVSEAVGSSICGGSAIAATAPVIDADDEEIAQSISVIFLFNVIAALIFPTLGGLLGLSNEGFGLFAGTAINDTSSVTAAAQAWDGIHGSNTLDAAARGIQRAGYNKENTVKWTSKYGSVIATGYDIGTCDGMNEKGLVASLLFLPESVFDRQGDTRPVMGISIWTQYVLDNFATVHEAVEELKKESFRIDAPHMPNGSASTLHLAITDETGNTAVLEYLDGNLSIHEGKEFQVMTNSPRYDYQLAINDYWKEIGGLQMLPGTNRSSDRFVRASFYIHAIPQTPDAKIAVPSVLSVMRNVSVPFGITTPDKPHISSTRWRSVSDQKNKIYYFESVMTPNLFWLDLKKIDFSPKAGIKKLPLTNGKIYAGDAVKDLKDSDSFVFLFQTPVM